MKYIITERQYSRLVEGKDKTIRGYHGSRHLIENFDFPVFITTSVLRAEMFAVSMKWNEELKRNQFRSLKGDEEGYLYHLEITNPIFSKWKGGPSDEKLVIDGDDIKVLDVKKVGVKLGFDNRYTPYTNK